MYIEAESRDLKLNITDLTYDGEFEDALEKANDQAVSEPEYEGGSYDDPILYEVEDFTFNLLQTPSFVPESEIKYGALDKWFDVIELLDDTENYARMQYLCEEEGLRTLEAAYSVRNVKIRQGTLTDMAYEDVDLYNRVPYNMREYFDYEAYGKDKKEWFELTCEMDGHTYVVLNHGTY